MAGRVGRLVIAEPAARDLKSTLDYIALDNPVAAESVYRGIFAAAQKLPQLPALECPGRCPDTRELSVSGLPYLIVYARLKSTAIAPISASQP